MKVSAGKNPDSAIATEKSEKITGKDCLKNVLTAFFLASACITFEILCITFFRTGMIARRAALFVSLSCSATIALFVAATLFSYRGKRVAYRSLISVFILLLLFLVMVFVLQKTGMFYVLGNEELFRAYLRRAGALMPLLYILFQFLQVIVLPVPAFVSTVAGVALFGPFKAALCSFVGIISGSLAAFFIGRKIGYKAVAWIVGKEDLDKWLKKVKGKDYFLLTAMFVLPLFPDDILCFVSGLSSMTWQYFVIMIVAARSLGIFATCYSVNFIPFNTWWGIAIWIALLALIVTAFVLLYKNLDSLNEFFKTKFSRKKRSEKK